MKYQLEFLIERPRDAVVALFLDPEKLRIWQSEIIRRDHVGGPLPMGEGTQYRQAIQMGKREIEMLDTVTIFDPPGHFAATYEADGVWNEVENWFEPDGQATVWTLTSDFRCTGLVMRLMATFAPGMFRKQTRTFMARFKAFAEQEIPAP